MSDTAYISRLPPSTERAARITSKGYRDHGFEEPPFKGPKVDLAQRINIAVHLAFIDAIPQTIHSLNERQLDRLDEELTKRLRIALREDRQ